MHNYSYLEAFAADRMRRRFAEAEESRLAHHARADSREARRNRGEAGSKKLRRFVPSAGQRRVLPATSPAFDPKGEQHDRRF